MNAQNTTLRKIERSLLLVGLALVSFASISYVGGRLYARWTVERFHASSSVQTPSSSAKLESKRPVDYVLWSPKRIQAYEATLNQEFGSPLALLEIEKINLEVPIFEGTDDRTLDRGLGWIAGTARIGEQGNIGIAGHRDGFFRGLKDIRLGDAIKLETTGSTKIYQIDSITMVKPNDVSVLKNESGSALTLVTCYPFYFVGSAPQRYIVHASLKGETSTQN
jgi:sortase A